MANTRVVMVACLTSRGLVWMDEDDPDATPLPEIIMRAGDYSPGDKITTELEESHLPSEERP